MANRACAVAAVCMVTMLSALPARAAAPDPESLGQWAVMALGAGDRAIERSDVREAATQYKKCVDYLDQAFAASPSTRTKTDFYSPRSGGKALATRSIQFGAARDLCVRGLDAANKELGAVDRAETSKATAQLDRQAAQSYSDLQKLVASARAQAKGGKGASVLRSHLEYSRVADAYKRMIDDWDRALQLTPSIGSATCTVLPSKPTYAAHLAAMRGELKAANAEWAAIGAKVAPARAAYDAEVKRRLSAQLRGDRKAVYTKHRGKPGLWAGKVYQDEYDAASLATNVGKATEWTYYYTGNCTWVYRFNASKLASSQVSSPSCKP